MSVTNALNPGSYNNTKVLVVCFVVWTLTNMDQAFFGFAIPGILAEFNDELLAFGIQPLQAVGIILTISFVLAAILLVFVGVAADKYGRRPMMCLLLAVSALLVGLQGIAGGIILLTILRAFGFGFSNGLSPITNAYVVENVASRYRGIAMGILQCGYPLGWFLASLFAAPLLENYGWRSMCFAAFLVVPLAGLFWWLLSDQPEPVALEKTASEETGGIGKLFPPRYRRYSIACIITYFCFGGAYAGSAFFFPTYFTEVRGYSPADAASLVGLSNFIAIAGYLSAAYVGEFVTTRRNVYIIWIIGGVISLLALLWIPDTRSEDLIFYSLMTALFYGSIAVLPVLVAELFDQSVRVSALSVCASAPLSLGFAVFPLIVPKMVGMFGWQMALSIVVCPLLIIAALAALLLPNIISGKELEELS